MGRGERATRAATWALLGLSLAAAGAFVVLRVALPSDGGRIAFYGDAWSRAGARIDPIDPPAPGLERGDLVERIEGRTLDDWLSAVLAPGAERPSGERVGYVVDRQGAPAAIDVTWTAVPLVATLVDGWSVVLLSVVVAAVAAFVYRNAPGIPAASALVALAAAIAGSSIPWLLGTTTSDVVRGGPFLAHVALTGGLYMLLWPAALHFVLVFPGPAALAVRRPILVPGAYAVVLGAYALALLAARVASPTNAEWLARLPVAQLAVVVPAVAVVLVAAVVRARRTTDRGERTRIRWATGGALLSAATGLLLFQAPELLAGRSLVPQSWIGLAGLPLPLGVAAAILRDRLFGIEVVVNRALVYGGMTVGVLASYVVATAALAGIAALAGTEPGFAASLLGTGLAALVALPLRDALQRGVNRLMYGDRDEPWRAMRRLAQRLEWAAEPDRVFPAIAETVAEALRSPFVALEVGDPDAPAAMAAHVGEPRTAHVIVPLLHGAEPVGRLVIGLRAGETGFRGDERALVEDLARQAGTAVRAVRLREELARSTEALVVAREEERRRLRRDLHDGLGPALAAVGLRAEAAADLVATDPATAERRLREVVGEIGVALAEIRRLVEGLRPPALDELGLAGAIRQQAERLQGRGSDAGGPRIDVRVGRGSLAGLPAAVEVAAYRIAVEAVTNAVRHAGATTCEVRVEANGRLVLEVVDDGSGVPSATPAGVGLESMRIRAAEVGGELVIEPRGGGGTRVLATLPIPTQP